VRAARAPSAPSLRPVPVGGFGGGGGGSENNAPVLSLNLIYNTRTSVTLYGTVTDNYASPAGLTITITGVVNATVVTDSAGNFTLTTNAAGLGIVDAVTIDSRGIASNVASVTIQANPPVIGGFTATEGANHVFTFSGAVTDQTPAGLTVSFGGIPSLASQSTTVNADGSFSLTLQLQCDGSDNGTAWAQTTDWWGLQSNVATVSVIVGA
jgi:hypothetical protein